MFRTLIYLSSGACDFAVELPHRLLCSQFVVCWRFGAAGFEWCPCCRLKHKPASACSYSVEWLFQTVMYTDIRQDSSGTELIERLFVPTGSQYPSSSRDFSVVFL